MRPDQRNGGPRPGFVARMADSRDQSAPRGSARQVQEEIGRNQGYTGELTPEQLQAIAACTDAKPDKLLKKLEQDFKRSNTSSTDLPLFHNAVLSEWDRLNRREERLDPTLAKGIDTEVSPILLYMRNLGAVVAERVVAEAANRAFARMKMMGALGGAALLGGILQKQPDPLLNIRFWGPAVLTMLSLVAAGMIVPAMCQWDFLPSRELKAVAGKAGNVAVMFLIALVSYYGVRVYGIFVAILVVTFICGCACCVQGTMRDRMQAHALSQGVVDHDQASQTEPAHGSPEARPRDFVRQPGLSHFGRDGRRPRGTRARGRLVSDTWMRYDDSHHRFCAPHPAAFGPEGNGDYAPPRQMAQCKEDASVDDDDVAAPPRDVVVRVEMV